MAENSNNIEFIHQNPRMNRASEKDPFIKEKSNLSCEINFRARRYGKTTVH
jgi:hypothetical protein